MSVLLDENGPNESTASKNSVIFRLMKEQKPILPNSIPLVELFEDWANWQAYSAQQKQPNLMDELQAGKHSPWLWGLDEQQIEPATLERIKIADRALKHRKLQTATVQEIAAWVENDSIGDDRLERTLETLAILHLLPRIVPEIDVDLGQALIDIVEDQLRLGAQTKRETELFERQLRLVELPHLWAFVMPEIKGHAARLKTARRDWTIDIDEILDGQGSVRAADLTKMRSLLATWTRTSYLAKSLSQKPLRKQSRLRVEWLIREVVRWTRPDRHQYLDFEKNAGTFGNRFCEAAVRLSQDKEDAEIAEFALAKKSTGLSKKAAKKKVVVVSDLPSPANHSEWAETAALRTNWHPAGQSLFIDYSEGRNQIELFHTQELFAGELQLDLSIDGLAVETNKPWEEVCWHQDDDVCYLEIEQSINDRVSLQRQFLLAVQDRFFFYADAILSKDEPTVDYRLECPLPGHTCFETSEDSRDGLLRYGKHLGLVLPLNATEWRTDVSRMELAAEEHKMVVTGESQGKRHYFPFFIDLDPQRSKRPFTWRKLTVAKERVIETDSQAFGARVQVGKEQWVFFRALAPVAPRTVIGQHLNCEFNVSQFFPGSESIHLITVEQEDE